MSLANFTRFLSPQSSLHFLSLKNSIYSARRNPAAYSTSLSASAMESHAPYSLVLCGKSSTENDLAESLKNNNTLKHRDDTDFSVLLHSEMENHFEGNSFRISSYMNSLSTTKFGRFMIYSPRLPSTQDVVSDNFVELPIGAVCLADIQLKGRGRSKNLWESPMGCLLFSFTLQMDNGRIVPLLQYVVCLAVTEAIKHLCHKNGIPPLDVRIKWPNDLYLDGLKVGGILCTSTYKSMKFNVSAGIGLNVDNDKPTTCLNAILRKLIPVGYQLQREDIVAAFFNKFESFFDIFINEGFQPLEELYYKTWLHSGQRVTVQEMNENQDQSVETIVCIKGLTPTGHLLAVGEDGRMCELHPDGNSFDFLKGLVRRKLG